MQNKTYWNIKELFKKILCADLEVDKKKLNLIYSNEKILI